MNEHCIFCDIVAGQAPAEVISESPHTIAIVPRDIESPGHTLILPKRHTHDLTTIAHADLLDLMVFTQALSKFLVTEVGFDGVNILHASGVAAQQSVSHFHLHLIPRRLGDGLNAWPTLPGALEGLAPIAWSKIKPDA